MTIPRTENTLFFECLKHKRNLYLPNEMKNKISLPKCNVAAVNDNHSFRSLRSVFIWVVRILRCIWNSPSLENKKINVWKLILTSTS